MSDNKGNVNNIWPHADIVQKDGYIKANVDWSPYKNDYENDTVEQSIIDNFIKELKSYFDRNKMQVDWAVLDKQPIEKLINNLVLCIIFSLYIKTVIRIIALNKYIFWKQYFNG